MNLSVFDKYNQFGHYIMISKYYVPPSYIQLYTEFIAANLILCKKMCNEIIITKYIRYLLANTVQIDTLIQQYIFKTMVEHFDDSLIIHSKFSVHMMILIIKMCNPYLSKLEQDRINVVSNGLINAICEEVDYQMYEKKVKKNNQITNLSI